MKRKLMKRKETYYVDEEKIAAFKNFSFFSLFFVSFFSLRMWFYGSNNLNHTHLFRKKRLHKRKCFGVICFL